MDLFKLLVSSLLVIFALGSDAALYSQESSSEPIYLDEPEPEPPVRIVLQETKTENYEDEKPRLERGLAKLSDDQVVNHGTYVEYYRNGQKFAEGTYELGLHVGEWKFWYPNGQLCKTVSFKAGKPHGTWDVARPDGTRESTRSYEDGLRHNQWINYYEDGEKRKLELTYNMGQVEGQRLLYYPNGQLQQQIPFENGVMQGTIITWDEQGNKVSEMDIEQGKLTGQTRKF
ncbi:MAG: toxin-antitoxin system YwqK family antitoxin [Planctomycetales bacterium]|nr:toxin-antitoxin system YwqK family antitoxin [Planctomycetales bacterium]